MKFRATCALPGLFLIALNSAYAQSSECDYTNAAAYDGWGWNAATQQSCEPVICQTTQRDPDGDGLGLQDGQLCTVSDATESVPSFTNRQTGEPVVFTPVYWDANKDIANRNLQCDSYYFDEDLGEYVVDDETFSENRGADLYYTSWSFYHHPTAPIAPYEGWVETLVSYSAPVWSVENGVYDGLGVFASPYLEIVSPPGSSRRIRHWTNAGRINGPSSRWFNSALRYDGYIECRDTSGADFAPTGTPGSGTSVSHTLSDFQISPDVGTTEKPTIINAATGENVELINPVWNYNADIANRGIGCAAYWLGSDGEFTTRGEGSTVLQVPYLYTDSPETLPAHSVLSYDGIQSLYTWSVVDGIPTFSFGGGMLGGILNTRYIEVSDNWVRSWASDGESFYGCYGTTASGIHSATDSPLCDYSNADLYNGWGWNSATMESCPPVQSEQSSTACDYTNAALNGGWGWDAGSQQSCPPVSNPPTANSSCDYSSAALHDGWGWNADTMQSCPPVNTPSNIPVCVDSDGDGYGWDGASTCVL